MKPFLLAALGFVLVLAHSGATSVPDVAPTFPTSYCAYGLTVTRRVSNDSPMSETFYNAYACYDLDSSQSLVEGTRHSDNMRVRNLNQFVTGSQWVVINQDCLFNALQGSYGDPLSLASMASFSGYTDEGTASTWTFSQPGHLYYELTVVANRTDIPLRLSIKFDVSGETVDLSYAGNGLDPLDTAVFDVPSSCS